MVNSTRPEGESPDRSLCSPHSGVFRNPADFLIGFIHNYKLNLIEICECFVEVTRILRGASIAILLCSQLFNNLLSGPAMTTEFGLNTGLER
jgi:hypothetical protein